MSNVYRRFLYLLIIVFIVFIDQISKLILVNFLLPYETVPVLPFMNIVNVRNEGAAFGLFQSLGNRFFIVITVVAIVIILYLLIKSKEDSLSLSFIMAGALGNLIDRLRLGYVVDFLDLHIGNYHWPAFNVADASLSIGIGLLFIRTLIKARTYKTRHP